MNAFILSPALRRLLCMSFCIPLLLALSACGGDDNNASSNAVSAANTNVPANAYTAVLSGAQEVPPTSSTATAAGAVLIDPNTKLLRATLNTAGLVNVAAHIHLGPAGVAGAIIFPMNETPAGSGVWTTQATVTDAQIALFNSGGYYFNVHSPGLPGGEIRGQILAQLANAQTATAGTALANTTSAGVANAALTPGVPSSQFQVAVNVLSGSQQLPANASPGIGLGVIVVDRSAKTLSASLLANGVSGNAARLLEGPTGLNGTLAFPLTAATGVTGVWTAKVALTDAQLASYNSGRFYFDVLSAAFPGGELRGQVLPLTSVDAGGATANSTNTGSTTPAAPVTGTTGTGATGTSTTGGPGATGATTVTTPVSIAPTPTMGGLY